MGSPGLLANRPTSRQEHAIFVTRDGVECFDVFGLSGFQAARFHRSDPAMEHDRSLVAHFRESGARAQTNP